MENIDLFQHTELLPQEVQDVIMAFGDMVESYENCEKLLSELNKFGYTFDYGLDAVPFNLQKI